MPPKTSILFNFRCAKKATKRLSGDQKGKAAPSVPSRARDSNASSGRIQSRSRPSGVVATKASLRPSGEIAGIA